MECPPLDLVYSPQIMQFVINFIWLLIYNTKISLLCHFNDSIDGNHFSDSGSFIVFPSNWRIENIESFSFRIGETRTINSLLIVIIPLSNARCKLGHKDIPFCMVSSLEILNGTIWHASIIWIERSDVVSIFNPEIQHV